MGPSPIGFRPGRPRPQEPSTATRPAGPPAGATPPTGSPATERPLPGDPEGPSIETEPRGLRGRVERLRELASGRQRPLGSPEGRGEPPRPRPSRSRDSSDERRVVDALAVVIRQLSRWVDWGIGERTGRDFVATAEECMSIAAPAAGFILDRTPETGLLADLEERAGLVGAAVAGTTYVARAALGRPGGRAESEELHEAVVRRLSRARRREFEEAAERAGTDAPAGPAPPARPYGAMLGLDDEDVGIDDVGPA